MGSSHRIVAAVAVVGSCRKVKVVAIVGSYRVKTATVVESYKVKMAAADTPHRVVVLVDNCYVVAGGVVIVGTAEIHQMVVTVGQDCSVDCAVAPPGY
jgi:hypothetical protein